MQFGTGCLAARKAVFFTWWDYADMSSVSVRRREAIPVFTFVCEVVVVVGVCED